FGRVAGRAAVSSVGDETTAGRQRRQRLLEDCAANGVQDDIDRPASVRGEDAFGQSGRIRVDRSGCAKLECRRALLVGGGGRDNGPGAELPRELDRERAHAPGGSEYEDRLTGRHARRLP